MSKNSSEYWEKRIANNTWATYNSIEEKNRALLEFYDDAVADLKEELYSLAEKYSKNGTLTLSDMHKKNRLTNLQKNYENIIKALGKKTEEFAKDNMFQSFNDRYEDVSNAIGVTDFSLPNKELMEELLQKPWRGDDFSSRLWKNQKKLAVSLNNQLLLGLQQGKTTTEIAIAVSNIMRSSFNSTHTLVRTETMHYLNQASMQSYKDAGVKYVQIWAAEDERTCEECGQYHEKIYPIDKCPVLPFHPNCRCTIIPVTDDGMVDKLNSKYAANDIKRNTNSKVRYNEKYDYSINIDGYPQKVIDSISKHARLVAKKGDKDGLEHMYLINTISGEKEFYESGTQDEVGGEDFWDFVDKHSSGTYAFIHNHNTDGYFSETDLRTLLQEKCINTMIAVRNDAIIYVAEKGKNLPKTGYFDDLYANDLKLLSNDIKSGKISYADRNLKREEIIVDGLIRDYTKKGALIEINGQKK